MRRFSAMLPLLLLALLPACGVQTHAAESAIIEVMGDYTLIREHVENVAPDRAKHIEDALDAAKESLERGDLKATMLATRDLKTKLKELSDQLPALRAELEASWNELTSSVPDTLTTLNRMLNRANRPAAGARREAFDAAKSELPAMMAQWRQSRTSMENGGLAEAVSKAKEVQDWASRVMADIQDGS